MAKEGGLLKKVVLRMRDGGLRKCSIYSNLAASYQTVKVLTTEGQVETVDISDLKAVFFVRDFEGTPGRHAQRTFKKGSPMAGQVVSVRFPDGELIRGRVLNLAENKPGFFLYPADPEDNNEMVFVLRAPDIRVEVEP